MIEPSLARACLFLFAVIDTVGVVWFWTSLENFAYIGVVLVLLGYGLGTSPIPKKSDQWSPYFMAGCGLGAIAAALLLVNAFSAIFIDWIVVLIRAIHIFLFVNLGLAARSE